MNKKYIIRIILYLLVITWMTVIFKFSNMNTNNSDSTSKLLLYRIVSISNISETQKNIIVNKYNIVIRKIAHITEYFILYLLIYLALIYSNINKHKSIIYSVIISILYSISDEIHQLFVGRGGQVLDVFIDSIGIICCIIIIKIKHKLTTLKDF